MKSKFIYTGIRVRDLEKSVQFYTELLGMKEKGRNKFEATRGIVVGLVGDDERGPELELNYYEEGSRFAAGYAEGDALDHLAFQVENLDKALAEFARAGYPVALEMKTESSRWAYVKDPNGVYVELFE